MNKKSILTITLSAIALSGCAAPLIIAGGGAVGAMALKDKGISGTINDSAINAAIAAHLHQKSSELFTQVDVDVYMGEVLLTGFVKDPSISTDVEKTAWKTGGVRTVYNHIQTSEASSLLDFTNDTWITAKLKTRFLAEEGVNSLNYFIKTIAGTVYIMGTAESPTEMKSVKVLLSSTNGVKQVISYITTKEASTETERAAEKPTGSIETGESLN
jgi:osmotically-inducible protein OsmY